MKDISKERLSPGEVGQLDGLQYIAVARNQNTCEKCEFDRLSKVHDCHRAKCSSVNRSIYFVKV